MAGQGQPRGCVKRAHGHADFILGMAFPEQGRPAGGAKSAFGGIAGLEPAHVALHLKGRQRHLNRGPDVTRLLAALCAVAGGGVFGRGRCGEGHAATQAASGQHSRDSFAVAISKRGRDDPDRHCGRVVGVDPAERLAPDTEAVAGMDCVTRARNLQVQRARDQVTDLLRGAGDRMDDFGSRRKGGMHHFEIVGQVRGQQFLDQPRDGRTNGAARTLAHDVSGLVRGRCGVTEQHRHRYTQMGRDVAQVGDRRLGQVTLDLAQPADRTAQRIRHVLQGDPRALRSARRSAPSVLAVSGADCIMAATRS